jgi:hypothetical protein
MRGERERKREREKEREKQKSPSEQRSSEKRPTFTNSSQVKCLNCPKKPEPAGSAFSKVKGSPIYKMPLCAPVPEFVIFALAS